MSEIEERPHKRPRVLSNAALPNVQDRIETFPLGTSHAEQAVTVDKERIVGIIAYVFNKDLPFEATYKARYTDFLVNEILPDGQVVHLTSTAVPEELRSKGKSNRKDRRSQLQQHDRADAEETKTATADQGKTELRQDVKPATGSPFAAEISHQEPSKISDDDKQKLIEYLNEPAVTDLLSLYEATFRHPERKSRDHPAIRTGFTADRSLRTEIHGAIRRIFDRRIDSATDKDGYLVLTAAAPTARRDTRNSGNPGHNGEGQGSARQGKLSWLDRGGEHLHFTLYKENKDTMEAISFLVRQMKTNAKVFQFAGTKDKRAATAQRVSAFRVDVERLAAQNRSLRNARVGDFEYQPHGLELGDLTGNEFTITLRDCRFPNLPLDHVDTEARCSRIQEILSKQMYNLHHKGFLNYYGLQRFGTFATRTDEIGLLILKSDFKAACEGILYFRPELVIPTYDPRASHVQHSQNDNDNSDGRPNSNKNNKNRGFALPPDDNLRATALHVYNTTNNLHKALDILPRRFTAETVLLRQLHRNSADYLGALLAIPRNLRLMYVHAYQSLVWNSAVTNRWQLYGSKVMPGDLVLVSEHRDKENIEGVHNGDSTGDSGQSKDRTDEMEGVDADGEIVVAPAANDRAHAADDLFERARILTAAEASSGQYTIFDLVLPLPGFDIIYPDNPSGGEFYKTFMGARSDAGDGLDPYDMRRKHRDFSLSGGYRKIMGRIDDGFEVDVRAYTRDEEQFVTTDLDRLKSQQRETDGSTQEGEEKVENASEPSAARREEMTTASPGEQQEQREQQIKIAAILKFKLGSSQYATMVLRELSRGGVDAFKADFGGSASASKTA